MLDHFRQKEGMIIIRFVVRGLVESESERRASNEGNSNLEIFQQKNMFLAVRGVPNYKQLET